MTRFWYGGKLPDWTFTSVDGVSGVDNLLQSTGGVPVTFYNQESGGSPYEDLLDASDSPITFITSSDGTDGRAVGTIPPFQGPDGVAAMWAEANGGPRLLIEGHTAQALLDVIAQSEQTTSNLTAHMSAANPHGVKLADLKDVDVSDAANGELLTWDASLGVWVPTSVPGLSGVVDLSTVQTISGLKTFESVDDSGVRLRVRANANGQVDDLFQAWTNANQGEGGQRQRTTYLNPKGELRVNSAKGDSVAVRFKGQPSQTAHVLEQADAGDNPVSWWEPNGSWRAPNLGLPFVWHQEVVKAETGQYRVYNPAGVPLTIRNMAASVGGDVPAGSSIILQLRINGTAAFADANRPAIAAGQRWTGVKGNLSTAVWPVDGYITVDVVQPGSTTAGTKMTVQVLAY